jgi:hypothetical protein
MDLGCYFGTSVVGLVRFGLTSVDCSSSLQPHGLSN